jgi:hypothetical protein
MGAAAAAVLIRREREVVAVFRSAGATAIDRASSLDGLGLHDSLAVRRLRRRAVLREGAPGAWWLDEPSWAALGSSRRRVAVLMLVMIAVLAAAGVFASRTPSAGPPVAPAPAPAAR